MTVVVISHTRHFCDSNGNIVGWGSTVNELNNLAERVGSVVHIACLHENASMPKNVMPYTDKVRFVPIPPYGGPGFRNKLSVISKAFRILKTVRRELKSADVFQFRAPTSMGLYLIPFLSLFSSKKGWYKYAGNWQQAKPPISSAIQKWMLLQLQRRPVTINGQWPDQPAHCLTFENPCLSDDDRLEGEASVKNKTFQSPFTFCFVGRLENEKGVFDVLEALKSYPDQSKIGSVEIIGEGHGRDRLVEASKGLPFKVNVHGSMQRDQLFAVYKKAHFILLPSESEGFPKVIAEAANFGCIPVVSDVSCIGQYVNEDNGYLWDKRSATFVDHFAGLSFDNAEALEAKARNAHDFARSFTYEHYCSNIRDRVFKIISPS